LCLYRGIPAVYADSKPVTQVGNPANCRGTVTIRERNSSVVVQGIFLDWKRDLVQGILNQFSLGEPLISVYKKIHIVGIVTTSAMRIVQHFFLAGTSRELFPWLMKNC